MSGRWPTTFKNVYGVEQPPMEPPMVVTWSSPRDPACKPPGWPPNRQAFKDAIDYVLRQQAKRPNAKVTPLSIEAAEKFHVSAGRVREAVKNMGKKQF
jgi:hypothetical protein